MAHFENREEPPETKTAVEAIQAAIKACGSAQILYQAVLAAAGEREFDSRQAEITAVIRDLMAAIQAGEILPEGGAQGEEKLNDTYGDGTVIIFVSSSTYQGPRDQVLALYTKTNKRWHCLLRKSPDGKKEERKLVLGREIFDFESTTETKIDELAEILRTLGLDVRIINSGTDEDDSTIRLLDIHFAIQRRQQKTIAETAQKAVTLAALGGDE